MASGQPNGSVGAVVRANGFEAGDPGSSPGGVTFTGGRIFEKFAFKIGVLLPKIGVLRLDRTRRGVSHSSEKRAAARLEPPTTRVRAQLPNHQAIAGLVSGLPRLTLGDAALGIIATRSADARDASLLLT